MIVWIVSRALMGVLTVLTISILAFFIIQLPPGDIVQRYMDQSACGNLGDSCQLDDDQREIMRRYFGVDQGMVIRYFKWLFNLLQGDLGISFLAGEDIRAQPVKDRIGDRIWMTIWLTGFTILVTWSFAIPVGIYSGVRSHSLGDYVFTFIGFTGLAVPDFLLGLVLMYAAYAYFDQSVGGLFSGEYEQKPWDLDKLRDFIAHLWIPAIVLGTSGTASLIRILRNNLLDEINKPYVVTARAKGLTSWRLILKYPVRVALNPLVSTIGYILPSLVSGSIIVSVVLSLPTMGPILLWAIQIEDVYTAGLIIFMYGSMTVVGTFVSDIMLAWIDPRIRLVGR